MCLALCGHYPHRDQGAPNAKVQRAQPPMTDAAVGRKEAQGTLVPPSKPADLRQPTWLRFCQLPLRTREWAPGQPDPRHGPPLRTAGCLMPALGAKHTGRLQFRTTQPRSASATAYGFHVEGTQQCTPSRCNSGSTLDGCTLGACAGHRQPEWRNPRRTSLMPSRGGLKSR